MTSDLQLAAGAFLISFSAVFVKLAHVGPTASGFYRMLFGGLMLLGVLAVRRERLLHGFRQSALFGACGLFFALDLTFWHRCILYVGPGLASLLANFQVFFLALFGIGILGEKMTARLAVSIPLAMAGLYLLVGLNWSDLGPDYRRGVFMGVLTALCYAAYLITLRKARSEDAAVSGISAIACISLSTALIMGLELGVSGEDFGIPDGRTWAALTAYGLFGQVLGWVLISRALPRVPASRTGLILLLQPTLAFGWDVLFFNRPLLPVEILGALLALAAIYMGAVGKKDA